APGGSALPSGAQGLDDEQRVALGLAVQLVGVRRIERVADDPLGANGRLLPGEPTEGALGQAAPGPPPGPTVVPGMAMGDVLAPCRGRDEQAGFRLGSQEIVEELQRFAVPPLEVIGYEQERPPGREDRPGDRVEQPLSLLALGQRLRAR